MCEKYNDERIKTILESNQIPDRLDPENIKKFLDKSSAEKKRKHIKHSKTLRIVSTAAAFAIVVSASVYFMKPVLFEQTKCMDGTSLKITEFNENVIKSMKPASAYSDVYGYFSTASKLNKIKNSIFGAFNNTKNEMDLVEEYADDSSISVEGADNSLEYGSSNSMNTLTDTQGETERKDYSETYSQETDVLEADIVKTDGNTIFYSSGDTLYISDAENGKFLNSYKTDISDKLGISAEGNIRDMYIYNDKLITICEYYKSANSEGDTALYNSYCYYDYYYGVNADTYVAVFDISNSLSVIGYYVQEGCYNDVRLMSDGYLYVISNDEKYLDYNETAKDDIESYIPKYCVGKEENYISPENIMIPTCEIKDVYNYVSYTNISGLNLSSAAPNQPVDMKSIAGYTNTIYCSQQNLYVISGYDQSEITRFSVSSGAVVPQASGKVNGYVNDQFSMSEYNGYFRIAVTENVWEESSEYVDEDSSVATNTLVSEKNSIYILDMDMNIVGSISDFGLNEHIKSVNFNGSLAYVVTFRQTDPLYAIDLSNPSAPVLLDEFKISGYSSYMQKWSDGMLLGFGAEADAETGWETGVKLTMFDNSDPNNLKELDTISIINETDYDYVGSEGIYERKALFIDPEKNIIGFPVEKWQYLNGIALWNFSYQFYSYENGQFIYKGTIGTDSINEKNNGYDFECFRRVVYIDGYFYAVSMNEFKSADAASFTETDSVKFS